MAWGVGRGAWGVGRGAWGGHEAWLRAWGVWGRREAWPGAWGIGALGNGVGPRAWVWGAGNRAKGMGHAAARSRQTFTKQELLKIIRCTPLEFEELQEVLASLLQYQRKQLSTEDLEPLMINLVHPPSPPLQPHPHLSLSLSLSLPPSVSLFLSLCVACVVAECPPPESLLTIGQPKGTSCP